MKILKKDLRKNEFLIKPEDSDDLWEISNFIEENDIITGKATRKIKLNKDVIKKTVNATIKIEKIKFDSDVVRVNGILLTEHEDIPKGSHQSINIEKNSIIKITKNHLLKYHLDRLEKSVNKAKSNILIVLFDKDEALIVNYNLKKFKVLYNIKSISSGKQYSEKTQKNPFFEDLAKEVEKLTQEREYDLLISASPGFWKTKLSNLLKNNPIYKRIIEVKISSVSSAGLNEILNNKVIKTRLANADNIKDQTYVEMLLTEISKDGLYCYGLKEVKQNINNGNADIVLVTNNFVKENKTNDEIINLLKFAENTKAKIHFVDSKNQAGIKLDSIGGIALITRYKTS